MYICVYEFTHVCWMHCVGVVWKQEGVYLNQGYYGMKCQRACSNNLTVSGCTHIGEQRNLQKRRQARGPHLQGALRQLRALVHVARGPGRMGCIRLAEHVLKMLVE
jgi:hypothetical protein